MKNKTPLEIIHSLTLSVTSTVQAFIHNDHNYMVILGVTSIVAIIISLGIFGNEFVNTPPTFSGVLLTILAGVLGGALSALVSKLLVKRPVAKVFISYSAKDSDFANQLARDLLRVDFQVIKDSEVLLVGDDISEKISDSISDSDFVIAIISRDSIGSSWFQKEIEYALKKGKKLLPILKETVEIPILLSSLKYADFTVDYKVALDALVKSLQASVVQREKQRA